MNTKQVESAQKSLLHWYETDARNELPWRQTSNIYHIYLSEVMLQQTQVSRVANEYYPNFLQKFPTLQALSTATLDEVFSMWSGLGYYRRAKNLHETAKICPKGLPNSLKELQKLPGIGRYTASAICSFGYKQAVSVVDTNIARVLKRFFAKEQIKEKELWGLADHFLNQVNPTEHNLALMDLGAMLCVPKSPKCDECPLAGYCLGKNEAEKYYVKNQKKYVDKELHYGIVMQNGNVGMVKSNDGMYKDMLELPSLQAHRHEDLCIGSFKHSVTHYRLKVFVYVLDELEEDLLWISSKEISSLPISSLTQKAFKLFEKSKV